jgi:hypothetical protein
MRIFLPAAILAWLSLAGYSALAADDNPAKAAEHKVTQSKSYLMVDPIYATILADDRPVGLLMIGVGIDAPEGGLRAEVSRAMPILRDAFLRNLTAFAATQVRTNRQPDVGVIADRLQAVADRALGRKGARVLLAQVAMRLNH